MKQSEAVVDAPVQSPLPGGGMRAEAWGQGGSGTARGRGWDHRDDIPERWQSATSPAVGKEAVWSVRCLRCHYTCDACLCTRLIINGVHVAAEGDAARLTRHRRSLQQLLPEASLPPEHGLSCSSPRCRRHSSEAALGAGNPASHGGAVPPARDKHTFTITPLFSPLQTLCLFSLLLLSSWLCHMQ